MILLRDQTTHFQLIQQELPHSLLQLKVLHYDHFFHANDVQPTLYLFHLDQESIHERL